MKLFKLSFLLLITISFISCGDDDPDTMACEQSNWAGTYTGTKSLNGTESDATVTLTAEGTDQIMVSSEVTTAAGIVTSNFDAFPISGCTFSQGFTTTDGTVDLNGTLSGDDLTISETLNGVDGQTTCNYTLSRM